MPSKSNYSSQIREITKRTKRLQITFAIVGMIVCAILLAFFISHKGGEEVFHEVGIHITSTLLIGLFIFFIWDVLKNNLEAEKHNQLIEDILSSFHGLRKVSAEEGFLKAINHLKSSKGQYPKEIKIIGSVVISFDEILNDYYTQTLNLFSQAKSLKYKRIISDSPNPELLEHLKNILEVNEKRNSELDCSVMVLENFIPIYNYLIIDNKFLLLLLNYKQSGDIKIDSYYTEDKQIVDSFANHFQDSWDDLEKKKPFIATTWSSFDQAVKDASILKNCFEAIRNSLTSANIDSHLLHTHLKSEIEKTQNQYTAFPEGYYQIEHSRVRNVLQKTYLDCLKILNNHTKLKAISINHFWLAEGKEVNAYLGYKEALEHGASLNRIFFIESQLFDDSLNDNSAIEIIGDEHLHEKTTKGDYKKNIISLLKHEFSELCNIENYELNILIYDKSKNESKEIYNFALIQRTKPNELEEVIIFNDYYHSDKGMMTDWVHFTYKLNQFSTKNEKSKTLLEIRKKFDTIKMAWEKQQITKEQIAFFKTNFSNYFNDKSLFQRHFNLSDTECMDLSI